MPKTNAETMTVRLPTQVANELIKLRNEKNLPTIGSALQVYIQKMKEGRIEKRLDELEKGLTRLLYLLEKEKSGNKKKGRLKKKGKGKRLKNLQTL